MSNKLFKAGFTILAIAYLALSLMMIPSCTGSRLSKGEGCQNGYVGYGETAHVIKGHKR